MSVLKTGRRLSSTPADAWGVVSFKVFTSPGTRVPFLLLALGCGFLLYLAIVWAAYVSPLFSILLFSMAIAFSLYLYGTRYEVSIVRIELRTNWQVFWSESALGLTRVTPDRGITPFGDRVEGFRLQFPHRTRFVAPLEPEKFLQEIRRVRPELRWWGGELRAEIPGFRLPSVDQSAGDSETLEQ